MTSPATRVLAPLLADLVCVVVFAAAGKSSHEASDSEWVVLAIVWPFAVAVALAHAILRWRRARPARVWPEGALVVAVTYVLGMALRVLSERGIAVGFLIVAAVFLSLTMLGWRGAVRLAGSRRG